MPTGPNRSGSDASMMQYTYLPRLALVDASTVGPTLPPCTIRSAARSAPRPLRAAAVRDSLAPRAAGRAAARFATFFLAGGGETEGPPRGRSLLRTLAVGFPIFSGPAGPSRRG